MKLNNYKAKFKNLLKSNNNNQQLLVKLRLIEINNQNLIQNSWKSEGQNKHLINKIILITLKYLQALQKLLKNLKNLDNKLKKKTNTFFKKTNFI